MVTMRHIATRHISALMLVLGLVFCPVLTPILISTPAYADWRDGTSLPTAVSDAVAASIDDGLYVMSGAPGRGLRQFFEFYDTQNDGWRPLTPMPASLWRFSLTSGNGQLYVTGGRDQATGDLSPGVWMYTPQSAIWVELPALPDPRAGHASFFADGHVYLIGGVGANSTQVVRYVSRAGRWESVGAPMPVPVANAAWTRKGDQLIIAGGVRPDGRDTKFVQTFNIKTLKWARLADLPQASSGGALGVVGDALHYAGGFSQAQQMVLARHVGLAEGAWRDLAEMPQGRHQMAYAGDGERLFIIGGALGGGFYSLFTGSNRVHVFTTDTP